MNPSLRPFLFPLSALSLALATAPSNAIEISQAELFIELNHTDGDLGLHAAVDGGPYRKLEIEDPLGRDLLLLVGTGRLAAQGLTQFFMESAEPSFDELPPEAFFLRFPEGVYEISIHRAGMEAEASVTLSHVLAAPPDSITVAGVPAAENCDAPDVPQVGAEVVIDWDPVTSSHPSIGKAGPVEISRYQFFVEQGAMKLGLDLPPSVTSFEIPEELLASGGRFKFEIIARTASGNNTAIESCFDVTP